MGRRVERVALRLCFVDAELAFRKRLPGRQGVQERAKAALGCDQPEAAAVGVHDVCA